MTVLDERGGEPRIASVQNDCEFRAKTDEIACSLVRSGD
jgi:hypothetical protein